MIDFLEGILIRKSPTRLVIDVQGIGFEINITLPCFESLGEINEKIKIATYLHVREDALLLYGFKSSSERELFLQLISSPGIGPKKAQAILSSVSAENLQRYIVEENLSALTALSGVGQKTAQRLILDLKDKLKDSARFDFASKVDEDFSGHRHLMNEAETALISLGFNKNSARAALQQVIKNQSMEMSLEELIKQALRQM